MPGVTGEQHDMDARHARKYLLMFTAVLLFGGCVGTPPPPPAPTRTNCGNMATSLALLGISRNPEGDARRGLLNYRDGLVLVQVTLADKQLDVDGLRRRHGLRLGSRYHEVLEAWVRPAGLCDLARDPEVLRVDVPARPKLPPPTG